MSALIDASKNNKKDELTRLIQSGIDVNFQNESGATALISAATNGHLAIAKALISAGANVDIQNKSGWTAVANASAYGYIDMTNALIGARAALDIQDKSGYTALSWAAINGHLDVAEALISAGANMNIRSHDGSTALHRAEANNKTEMVKLLKARGADVTLTNNAGNTPEEEMLVRQPSGVTERKWYDKVFNLLRAAHKPVVESVVKAPASRPPVVFLSHNWGVDQANHIAVSRVNEALRQRGVETWFDTDQMSGDTRESMKQGIKGADAVVLFLTEEYQNKINHGDTLGDNCRYEFTVATDLKKPIVTVRMETFEFIKGEDMFTAVGRLLYIDMTDRADVNSFNEKCDKLVKEIKSAVAKEQTKAPK